MFLGHPVLHSVQRRISPTQDGEQLRGVAKQRVSAAVWGDHRTTATPQHPQVSAVRKSVSVNPYR